MDIVLDTPVLVLPRSSCSSQVFVAHLGKISLNNISNDDHPHQSTPKINKIFTIDEESLLNTEQPASLPGNYYSSTNMYLSEEDLLIDEVDGDNKLKETYVMDVRNMNLYSLDTKNRKGFRLTALPRAEEFYSCQEDAVPVLHDTAIHLNIMRTYDNPSIDLMADMANESIETLKVTGSVVKPLTLSLSRKEYEQLLETIENLFKVPVDLARPPTNVSTANANSLPLYAETPDEEDGPELVNQTFEFDKKFKRRLFSTSLANEKVTYVEPKVSFELPVFAIQLKSHLNDPLIEIFFRDFNVNYEKNNMYETSIQVCKFYQAILLNLLKLYKNLGF